MTRGFDCFGTGNTGVNSWAHDCFTTYRNAPVVSGYTPIGILGYAIGSNTDVNYQRCSVAKMGIATNGQIEITIGNNSDLASANLLLYVTILYMKNM